MKTNTYLFRLILVIFLFLVPSQINAIFMDKSYKEYEAGKMFFHDVSYVGMEDDDSSLHSDYIISSLSKFNLPKYIPKTTSKLPVYLAILLALALLKYGAADSNERVFGKAVLLLLLCFCILIHFFGYTGNTHWFTEDVGGLIRSTLAEGLYLLVVIITVGSSLSLLSEASEQGGFPTSFLIGFGSFVIAIPVYFVLWIFTDAPIRNTIYFLLFAQGIQLLVLLKNCISYRGNILHLLLCIITYPVAAISCFIIVKDYIFLWLMGQCVALNVFTLITKGFW